MPVRPHILPYLFSVGYAALIFIPLHEPGLLAASLLQLTICGCLLALLVLLLTYRREIRQLIEAAFRACADSLLCLIPTPNGSRKRHRELALPADPFRRALFSRPPPYFA